MIELREMRMAIISAQHRSLRQAAETLNIRQSTLSRRLRDLELRLGVVLFERTNGGTRPTVVGQEFLDAARQLIDETDAITERLKARSRGERGLLTVGVHAALTAGNLRATLIEHRNRFPEVETHIVDGSGEHLLAEISSSAIDVAFLVEHNSADDFKTLPVWSERVVVALPVDHPLVVRETVQWTDLRNERLLVPTRGPGPELTRLLAIKTRSPDLGLTFRQDAGLDRLLALVGVGWGLLLALEGATGMVFPGVTFREVHDDHGPTRANFCACWRGTNHNPSLRAFLDMLRERYPDLSAEPPSA